MKYVLAVVVATCAAFGVARAQSHIALDEIVGSWQGDDEMQYVELRMLAADQQGIANVAALVFDDATASEDGRRAAIFTTNVSRGVADAKILIATTKARDAANLVPDFLLPTGYLHPKGGRVCYALNNGQGFSFADCVAYGDFTGADVGIGPPTSLTPDNRALQRKGYSGKSRSDWTTVLDPVLERNSGDRGTLPATLCRDGIISQGEECDGDALGGATCASLGFAKGKLTCVQCHYDTSGCTACGNDAINGKEECDGSDLGERTCDSLGYTGGTLTCSDKCKVTTTSCDPSFYVAGGGPPKSDCLGEWRVKNTAGGPTVKGKTAARQTCKDGDAGCDADGAANGSCTFSVAACFSREDGRFAKCPVQSVSAWTLLGDVDPASPPASDFLAAIGALAPSTTAGLAVTFTPMLAEKNACSADVAVVVAAGSKLVLKARTDALAGKPKDTDVLRLACTR
jgi:hypothetical protein